MAAKDLNSIVNDLQDLISSLEKELRETQIELGLQNELFEEVFQNTADLVITLDLSGNITFTNPTFDRLFSGKMSKSKSFVELLNPEDRGPFERALLSKKELTLPMIRAKDPKGNDIYLGPRLIPISQKGTKVGYFLVAKEITGQISVLQEEISRRAEAESFLENVFWNIPIGLTLVATNGEIILANLQMEEMFGAEKGSLIGQKVDLLIPKKDRKQYVLSMEEYFEKPTPQVIGADGALFALRKNNEQFPVEVKLNPVNTENGFFVLASIIDISKRVHNEKEIDDKTRKLESMLYVTSHDLREPLRTIHNFADLFITKFKSEVPKEGMKYIDKIHDGAKRMDKLIHDILMLSKAQGDETEREKVGVKGIIHDALVQLDARIQKSGAKVEVEGEFPTFYVNRMWCSHAVLNLISNALKFTIEGKAPNILITPVPKHMLDPGEFGLVVMDRGPGVAEGQRNKIFQLFRRLVGREVEGTGAGLSIVLEVAERHGGRAWVEDREGGGAAFYLTFSAPVAKVA